jgi:hypothetical protein
MTITMFDQMQFTLPCGHVVVLGRLHDLQSWTCEECRIVTNLGVEPYASRVAHDRDTAGEIDKQAVKLSRALTQNHRSVSSKTRCCALNATPKLIVSCDPGYQMQLSGVMLSEQNPQAANSIEFVVHDQSHCLGGEA